MMSLQMLKFFFFIVGVASATAIPVLRSEMDSEAAAFDANGEASELQVPEAAFQRLQQRIRSEELYVSFQILI